MAKLSGNYGGGSKSSSKSSSSSRSSSFGSSGGRLNRPSSPSRPSSNKSSSSGGRLNGSGSSGGSRTSSGGMLSGNYGGSSSGGFSTPIPSGAKKVGGGSSASSGGSGSGGGYTVNTKVSGAYTDVPFSPGGSGSVPRYDNPNFKPISTPNSTGLIKGYNGGKLENGVIKYPTGANVDFDKAARAQAFVDYSYGNSTSGNSSMGALYGDAYYKELNRLANLKVGDPAWGKPQTGGSSIPHTQVGGGTAGGAGGGGYDFGGMPDLNIPAPDYSALMDQLTSIMNSVGGLSPGDLNGGTAGGGANGGTSAGAEISKENQDYLDAIEEAKRKSAEALQQQIEQGVNSINNQRDPLSSDYQKAAQQAYIAKMKGQKNLPEQLSAQGLTGGATESANLALEANYGNSLNDLTNSYNQGLSQLEQQAAQLKANGGITLAQNESQFEQMKASAAQQAQQQAVQIQAQKDLQAQQLQAQQNLAQYNAKIQMLQQAASIAAQMGMAQYQAQINAQLTQYEVAAQQEMAKYTAARDAALQAQQLAAQFDMTKYKSQIEAQQQEAQRLWEQQQQAAQQNWQKDYYKYQTDLDYDAWLKKQGYKTSKASLDDGDIKIGPDGGKLIGPTAPEKNPAYNVTMAGLMGMLGNTGEAGGSSRQASNTAPAVQNQLSELMRLYNSGAMTEQEARRRAQQYGVSLTF